MNAAGQTAFEIPLDPVQLAQLSAPERGKVYRRAGLDRLQIAASEDAVRLVLRREYGRAG